MIVMLVVFWIWVGVFIMFFGMVFCFILFCVVEIKVVWELDVVLGVVVNKG